MDAACRRLAIGRGPEECMDQVRQPFLPMRCVYKELIITIRVLLMRLKHVRQVLRTPRTLLIVAPIEVFFVWVAPGARTAAMVCAVALIHGPTISLEGTPEVSETWMQHNTRASCEEVHTLVDKTLIDERGGDTVT